MIYTACFNDLSILPKTITPVSVDLYGPDWYDGLEYEKLMPPKEVYDHWIETQDQDYYFKEYFKVLDRLFADEILAEVYALVQTEDIAFVSHERPDEYSHRELIRTWLAESGYNSVEWGTEDEQ